MDRDERDVRCYLRRVPMVGGPVDDLTEGFDNGTRKLDAVSFGADGAVPQLDTHSCSAG